MGNEGTPGYQAPEIQTGVAYDEKVSLHCQPGLDSIIRYQSPRHRKPPPLPLSTGN
jgi:hypothetical protein